MEYQCCHPVGRYHVCPGLRIPLQSNPDVLPLALSEFTRTARMVCEGQQYDMNFESRKVVTIGEYLEMIRLKTAVLIGCSS